MKIAIFGATGKTGIEVLKQALAHGHEVTVMVRDASRLQSISSEVKVIVGELTQQNIVNETIQGQDAVICVLGAKEMYKNSGIRFKGTQAILNGMEQNNVSRIVVMSSMGIGESWQTLPVFTKALFKLFMPAAREDHEAQENAVKSRAMNWTIIRPSGLTNEPIVTAYEFGQDLKPKTSRISRANVADLILKVVENNSHIREALTISN